MSPFDSGPYLVGMSGRTGGWVSAGASSGTLVQLLVSQTLGEPDVVMWTLLARPGRYHLDCSLIV